MQTMRKPLQRIARYIHLAVLAILAGPLLAADVIIDPYYEYRDEVGRGEFRYDDSEDIPWIESETEVLAMPKEEDLSPVELNQLPEGLELLVDKSRITVGEKDRIIRLWLWVRSKAGAANGTYEGFRCETREYKVYAYANPNRTPPVTKARNPVWKFANASRFGNYREELLKDYFCGLRSTRSPDEIIKAMTGEFRRERFLSE